ncbi:probable sucrose-phosphate synthase 2 [Salvia splendens]|uniref:probable sucrose-phosphate synthase 2 n=1 Tax=Salvia splendens TaxID=180675 RepID=UPI001C268FCC|nr:probable sucrose-phosphate synthase 2 [Salvia splendens]
MNTTEGFKSSQPSGVVEHDLKSSNSHCLSYVIKDLSKARKADDLRQKLRMRVLRCNLMYCRNSTRMQVVPLLASGSQALRDTDHEEMISGTHKTLIMKDVVGKGSEELPGSYLRDDIVPEDNPLIAYIKGAAAAREIFDTLRQLFKTAV